MKLKTGEPTLAEQIQSSREKADVTQRYAADVLGLTTVHLSYLENGRREPSVSVLREMSKLYGATFTIKAEG